MIKLKIGESQKCAVERHQSSGAKRHEYRVHFRRRCLTKTDLWQPPS